MTAIEFCASIFTTAEIAAVRFWKLLCWISWNPLWAGIFSGLFALLGAVIGGKFVLRSMKIQRSLDQLAAGRALSTELEMNLTAMATLAIVGRANPLDYLEFAPALQRTVVDDRLTLLSELLSPPEFQALVALYARASASFSLLTVIQRRAQPFTAGAVTKFTELAEEFALTARYVGAKVWPIEERERLEKSRVCVLDRLRQFQPTNPGIFPH